jgi:pentatricopeptide repeat protein
MRGRGIERNVHTFSALMNVCIKCGQYKLALDVFRDMQAEVRVRGSSDMLFSVNVCHYSRG